MDHLELSKIIYRQWMEDRPPRLPPGQARFVTGIPYTDSHLHQLEDKYGIRINLNRVPDSLGQIGYKIKDYVILDEQKFIMFLLRWS